MKALARLAGWFLVPVLGVGKLVGRLLPTRGYGRREPLEDEEAPDWKDVLASYEQASKDVVKWWLEGEGYTLDTILTRDMRKETARDIVFNLMNGVREGFIDPGFARCITYALSCIIIEQKFSGLNPEERPSPAWACEYCVFFRGLKDVLLPDPESEDMERRRGDKLGICKKHDLIAMSEVPTGACGEFTLERRKHLRVLKQTNEELQLWYLVHRHKSAQEELDRIKDFRREVKRQIEEQLKQKRRRRRTDYSLRSG